MYNWKDTRNYRRFRDENGNVIANVVCVDGVEVPVSDEVYEAYASMDRRERYLEERDNDDKPLSVDALLEEGYQKMRGMSYQEVLRTNGQISFPEVLRQQNRL